MDNVRIEMIVNKASRLNVHCLQNSLLFILK